LALFGLLVVFGLFGFWSLAFGYWLF